MVFVFGGSELKESATLIETGAYAREVRRIVRAVRLTMQVRRKLNQPVLSSFLDFTLGRLLLLLPKVIRFTAFYHEGFVVPYQLIENMLKNIFIVIYRMYKTSPY